jgi:hypothetical protein
MKTRFRLAALLGALLALAAGCGKKSPVPIDDPPAGPPDTTEYALADRTPGEGSVVRCTLRTERAYRWIVKDAAGKETAEPAETTVKEEVSYRETVDAFPDGARRPTKARVTIDKWSPPRAEAKGGPPPRVPDLKIDKPEPEPPVEGRELLVAKAGGDGRYDFRAADGKPLGDGARLFLARLFGDDHDPFAARDFLPEKPVRVSATWEVSIRPLMRTLNQPGALVQFDREKSKGRGKLVRVYEKDGRKYARVELTAEAVPTSSMKGQKGVTVNELGLSAKWEIDLCIDGSRHDLFATGTYEVLIDFAHEGEGSSRSTTKGTVTISEIEEKVGKAANPAKPGGEPPGAKK